MITLSKVSRFSQFLPKYETALNPLQRHRQPLEQGSCFPTVLSSISDSFSDLLHQLYGLMTRRACCLDNNWGKRCLCGVLLLLLLLLLLGSKLILWLAV